MISVIHSMFVYVSEWVHMQSYVPGLIALALCIKILTVRGYGKVIFAIKNADVLRQKLEQVYHRFKKTGEFAGQQATQILAQEHYPAFGSFGIRILEIIGSVFIIFIFMYGDSYLLPDWSQFLGSDLRKSVIQSAIGGDPFIIPCLISIITSVLAFLYDKIIDSKLIITMEGTWNSTATLIMMLLLLLLSPQAVIPFMTTCQIINMIVCLWIVVTDKDTKTIKTEEDESGEQ